MSRYGRFCAYRAIYDPLWENSGNSVSCVQKMETHQHLARPGFQRRFPVIAHTRFKPHSFLSGAFAAWIGCNGMDLGTEDYPGGDWLGHHTCIFAVPYSGPTPSKRFYSW